MTADSPRTIADGIAVTLPPALAEVMLPPKMPAKSTTGQNPPGGIITTADIIQAAEDGKDLNKVRVQGLTGQSPDAINPCDKHP